MESNLILYLLNLIFLINTEFLRMIWKFPNKLDYHISTNEIIAIDMG